jgi:hypothetical protein
MISVIICSASVDFLTSIKSNIAKTIGVPFEILAYDNSEGQRGICEIYNQGVKDANYEICCFVHEDVAFNSIGAEVVQAFEKNVRLGLLGIAGSSYKSLSPSGWQASQVPAKINFINLIQQYKYLKKAGEVKYCNVSSEALAKVAVIDGVWFCGKKDILTKYPFDSLLLKKFHGSDWIKAMLLIHEKWSQALPVNKASLNNSEMKFCEKKAFKSFINTMRKAGYSSYTCLKVLNRSGIGKRFGALLYFRLMIKCLSA